MRTQYSFMMSKGAINFWSNDTKLMGKVQDYIETLLDAEQYRRELEDVTELAMIHVEEGE